jgi:hypothetical protein
MESFGAPTPSGVDGLGRGVVTLMYLELFRGDGGFFHPGGVKTHSNTHTTDVIVRRIALGPNSAMRRDQFQLCLTGKLNVTGNVIDFSATVPGSSLTLSSGCISKMIFRSRTRLVSGTSFGHNPRLRSIYAIKALGDLRGHKARHI